MLERICYTGNVRKKTLSREEGNNSEDSKCRELLLFLALECVTGAHGVGAKTREGAAWEKLGSQGMGLSSGIRSHEKGAAIIREVSHSRDRE